MYKVPQLNEVVVARVVQAHVQKYLFHFRCFTEKGPLRWTTRLDVWYFKLVFQSRDCDEFLSSHGSFVTGVRDRLGSCEISEIVVVTGESRGRFTVSSLPPSTTPFSQSNAILRRHAAPNRNVTQGANIWYARGARRYPRNARVCF